MEGCGSIIDHVIVDRQVVGGVACGIGNAVADALPPLGVEVTHPPVGPWRVWELIRDGERIQ